MADILTLGGIEFTDYSPPERMMAGGAHAMIVHKLPGGSRVIDTLGPDEADVQWHGFFFGNSAYATCQALDAMRAAGGVIPLVWGGQFRNVIIQQFIYRVARLPAWVEYEICCTVLQNPSLGSLSVVVNPIDTLVVSDLASALAL